MTARRRRHLLTQRAARRSRGAKLLAPTTHGHQGSGPGTVPGAPPGGEQPDLVVDGQCGRRRADTTLDMMEDDGDSAMHGAPASAEADVGLRHDSRTRAATPLGADAAATPGGARGADTCGRSRLGGGSGGRARAHGPEEAGQAGLRGSSSGSGGGASDAPHPRRSAGDDAVNMLDDDGDSYTGSAALSGTSQHAVGQGMRYGGDSAMTEAPADRGAAAASATAHLPGPSVSPGLTDQHHSAAHGAHAPDHASATTTRRRGKTIRKAKGGKFAKAFVPNYAHDDI